MTQIDPAAPTGALDLLALDAGQTGIKARLRWADGRTHDDLFPGVLTDRPLAPQLADAIARIAQTHGATPRTVAMGVSGVTDVQAEASAVSREPGAAGVQRLIVAHDSVTSFLGVLGDRHGAVIAVGTGVVTLGVGPRAAARVDGWGNIMGDAGSGYWIGREALDAVMRAHDGRGPATALTTPVRERWPDLESAYIALQSAPDRVRLVASFASATAHAAADGDAVAQRICREAGAELALSVVTALRVTEAPGDAVVGATGGVLQSTLIREAFTDAVRAARPDVAFVPPAGTGVDGAVTLAGLDAGHPLRSRLGEVQRDASS